MKLNLKYFVIAILLFAGQLQAQEFAISVNAREIGRKDNLQVNYDISGEGKVSDFQLPIFGKQWKIVSGPQSGFQSVNINGRKSTITSYIYILSPTKDGKLTIPATTVEVNGKKIKCREVSVNVVKEDHVDDVVPAGTQIGSLYMADERKEEAEEVVLKPGEDAQRKIRDNLFIKVFPSKRKCYVGEPVLVTYKLYTRLRSQSRVVKQPSFTGCTVSEMTTDQSYKGTETINGKKYNAYMFRQVQLFPLQPGRITVGQALVDNTVTFLSSSSDFKDLYYGVQTGQEHNITLSTEPFFIEVLPLPGKEQQIAVGDFTVSTKLKRDTVAADETNALIVTVEGKGNFKSIDEPEIIWPEKFYHFDAIETDTIDRLSFPSSGKKVYEIPFEVSSTGKIDFPAVAFSYFDPAKGKYVSTKSDPLKLMVTPAIKTNLQQPVSNSGNGLFDIKYLLYILPIVFFLGAFFILKQSKKKVLAVTATNNVIITDTTTANIEIDIQSKLEELVLVQDDSVFYSAACSFARELIKKGKGNIELLAEVLQDCNTVMYTPIPSTSKKEVIEKLRQAVS
jgi:hypothetical protein